MSQQHRFRFGIVGRAPTRAAWQDFARAAPRTSAFRPWSFRTISARSWRRCRPSCRRQRSPLGCGSAPTCSTTTSATRRVLAKEAATVDLLTDGRFELGIGAGWSPSDYSQTGIPFDPGRVRLARLKEAVHIIKCGLRPRACHVRGHATTGSRDLNVLPKPVQSPRPPHPDRCQPPADADLRRPGGRHHRSGGPAVAAARPASESRFRSPTPPTRSPSCARPPAVASTRSS